MKIEHAIKHFTSQTVLARALGITDSAISRWKERGDIVPLKSALKLNNITGGALDLVLSDYNEKSK